MSSIQAKLEALRQAADERGVTPLAWWIGAHHHDEVRAALVDRDDVELSVEDGMLRSIGGLEVKVLTETPDRLALWCEEGALDL